MAQVLTQYRHTRTNNFYYVLALGEMKIKTATGEKWTPCVIYTTSPVLAGTKKKIYVRELVIFDEKFIQA